MVMRKTGLCISIVIAFLVFLYADDAMAQCTKDTDCKHDRICVNGECVNPSPTDAAPSVAQPQTPPQTEPAPPAAAPSQPAAPGEPQATPTPGQPATAQAPSQEESSPGAVNIALEDARSRRRLGRAFLISGAVVFATGGAMQAGWALEDCWNVGTDGGWYECELSGAGIALVAAGFVFITYGLVGMIIGPILIHKAKKALGQAASWQVSPVLELRGRASGVGFKVSF
jgi:hypothetical protein